jgi:hypothetical protein
MSQPGQWLDAAGATGQHQAIDHGTRPDSIDGIAEEPVFPSASEDSDIAFKKVIVDRHSAVFGVTPQIVPLVQGIGDGIAELAVGQNLRGDFVEPGLESVQDGKAVFLAKAANAIGLRFTVCVSAWNIDPVNWGIGVEN